LANSMTGFGRALIERDGRQLTIECKSVNHRYLDVSIRLPRTLNFLEDTIKQAISARLARGHVDVFVNYRNTRTDARSVQLDEALLTAYLAAAAQASAAAQMPNDMTLTAALRYPDVLTVTEAEEDRDALTALAAEAAAAAVEELYAMRRAEGERLCADLFERGKILQTIGEKIEVRAPLVVVEYQKKLTERIAELTDNAEIDQARLAAEVAYFADKANITEELVRLKSHLAAMEKMLRATDATGRKLDFLVQELNREMNTMGSKATDIEIASLVIEGKAEIEKIREQVQNIE